MKRITIDDILSYGPCEPYDERGYLEKLFAGRKYVYPTTVLKAKEIPAQDRLWLILQEDILPEKLLHELACDFAERTLQRERDAGREPDERSWNAIKVKRLWIEDQATDGELYAARDAARSVAWAAARDAARDAEYEWQCEHVILKLKEHQV